MNEEFKPTLKQVKEGFKKCSKEKRLDQYSQKEKQSEINKK